MKIRLIVLTAIALYSTTVQAGMTVLDQIHWVQAKNHGELIYETFSASPVGYSYADETLSAGASTNVSSTYYGQPSDEWTSYYTYADAMVDWYYWDEPGMEYEFWVRAAISTTFQPHGNTFEIDTMLYDEWWGCSSYVELSNETTGQRVYYADFFGGDYYATGTLNPDHIYNLYVYSGVFLTNPDYLFTLGETHFRVLGGELAAPVIPEPGSIMLGMLGVAGAGYIKRRRVL